MDDYYTLHTALLPGVSLQQGRRDSESYCERSKNTRYFVIASVS